MKKEPILVPKDKGLLGVLAEEGEQVKSAWIFLHRNDVEKLISIADDYLPHGHSNVQDFYWNATDDFPETFIRIEMHPDKIWLEVYHIDSNAIKFNLPADDPDNILFLKMDE